MNADEAMEQIGKVLDEVCKAEDPISESIAIYKIAIITGRYEGTANKPEQKHTDKPCPACSPGLGHNRVNQGGPGTAPTGLKREEEAKELDARVDPKLNELWQANKPQEQTVDPSPQHLGTCRRCSQTYLLGTNCGDEDHLPKK